MYDIITELKIIITFQIQTRFLRNFIKAQGSDQITINLISKT